MGQGPHPAPTAWTGPTVRGRGPIRPQLRWVGVTARRQRFLAANGRQMTCFNRARGLLA